MDTHKVAEPVMAVALAYEALDGVLRAHASLDALTAHSPEELRGKIRSINASIASSARALDDIVRRIGCGPNATVEDSTALFAENDVDELVASLPGLNLALHATP